MDLTFKNSSKSPPGAGGGRRRWRWVVLTCVVLLSLVVLGEPWWGRVALGAALRASGVDVEAVEFSGYRSWTLSNVSWEVDGRWARAERIEVPQLYPYLAFVFFSRLLEPEIAVSGWQVGQQVQASSEDSSRPLREVVDDLDRLRLGPVLREIPGGAALAGRWLPPVRFSDGSLRYGEHHLRVDEFRYGDYKIRSSGALEWGGQQFPFFLSLRLDERRLEFSGEEQAGLLRLGGALEWDETSVTLAAEGEVAGGAMKLRYREFGSEANPELEFDWDNPDWNQLAQQPLPWKTESSVLSLRLQERSIVVGLSGRGALTGVGFLNEEESWELDLEAEAALDGLRLEMLKVMHPDVQVHLSQPVALSWSPWELDRDAVITLRMNAARFLAETPLSELGWIEASLQGRPDPQQLEAPVKVLLTAASEENPQGQALTLEAAGWLEAEQVVIDTADLKFGESEARVQELVLLRADEAWRFTTAAWEASLDLASLPWVPRDLPLPRRAESAGSIYTEAGILRYEATLKAQGWRPHEALSPLELELEVLGHGQEVTRAAWILETNHGGHWSGVGSGVWSSESGKARWESGGLSSEQETGRSELNLLIPWEIEAQATDGGWQLNWSELRLGTAGGGSLVGVESGSHGGYGLPERLGVEATGLESNLLVSWLPGLDLPMLRLDALEFQWMQQQGLMLDITAAGSVEFPDYDQISWRVAARQDETGTWIERLEMDLESGVQARVSGRVPGALQIGADSQLHWAWLWSLPFALEVAAEAQAAPLLFPAGPYAASASDFDVGLEISGSLEHPRGTWHARAGKIRLGSGEAEALDWELSNVVARGAIGPERIELTEAAFRFADQPVVASAALPVDAATWRALWQERAVPDFSELVGRLESEAVPMALFSPWLPEGIRHDRGRVSTRVEVRPGLRWQAQLGLQDIFLGYPGQPWTLERTSGRLRYADGNIEMEGVRGFFSGREVRAEGRLRLDEGVLQESDLRLTGTNLPLMRSNDLFLKADIDLRLVKTAAQAHPEIRGRVRPRDGLYLQDILGMLEPGTLTAEQRPPYFSIGMDPFASWGIDVAVVGERALRIHTALFRGVVSTDLRLVNTLEDPRLAGEITVDEGTVLFPYGRIRVRDSEVRFERNNPDHPQLDIRGSGRAFGYQLDMELSGPVDEAAILFESDPPLRTEEVLLLLTTGAIPGAENGEGGLTGTAGRLAVFFGQGLLGVGGGSERLRVTSGEDITESGNETYSVEYELREGLSLRGEYDRFDDYNLDLNWRIRRE